MIVVGRLLSISVCGSAVADMRIAVLPASTDVKP